MSEALEAGLDVLLGHLPMLACRRVDAPGEGLAFELAPPEGHAIVIRERGHVLSVEFGGWVETLALDEDGWEPGEPEALVLDFAAAALLGDLRVEQIASRGLVRVHVLWVRVEGAWRRHATRGRRPWLQRTSSTLIRHALARPPALRSHAPRGQPHAPWAGAGGFDWIASGEAKAMPIDGELDLHDFPPREVGALVRAYLDECVVRGILDVRIVHGKGIGALRRTVQAILAEHPAVERHRLGGHGEGSWGATIVRLRAPQR